MHWKDSSPSRKFSQQPSFRSTPPQQQIEEIILLANEFRSPQIPAHFHEEFAQQRGGCVARLSGSFCQAAEFVISSDDLGASMQGQELLELD